MTLAVLIMAGGSGTRLWPLSRPGRAKQFSAVIGAASLLAQTYARACRALAGVPVFVNVTAGNEGWVRRLLPDLPAHRIIVAPEDRDTLPTLGFATLHIERELGDATLVMLASDNWIGDRGDLATVLAEAVEAADAGPHLVSIGIRPTRPTDQYGYMQVGEKAPFGHTSHVGLGYLEKPSVDVAAALIASGSHDWNSGMFAWRTRTFWDALREREPRSAEIFLRLAAALAAGADTEQRELFQQLPRLSIDNGILERVGPSGPQRHVFVRADLDWDDLGNFEALARHLPEDTAGNRLRGPVQPTGSEDCIVVSDATPVEVRGLRDLIVVSDGTDLLVAGRRSFGRVRELAEATLWTGMRPAPGANRFRGFVKAIDATGCVVRSTGEGVIALLDVSAVSVVRADGRILVAAVHDAGDAVDADRARSAGPGSPTLRVTVADDEPRMSRMAAEHVVAVISECLARRHRPLVMFSAGKTPLGLFALLRTRYRGTLDWTRVRVAQMDEWVGADERDSYAAFLRRELIDPLGIGQFLSIDAHASHAWLADHERLLADEGLDLVVHGIGCNGHLGFNEPGADFAGAGGRVALRDITRSRAASSFGGLDRVPTHGLTLGLGTLNAAREVVLMASSADKSPALRDALFGPIDTGLPASSLRLHPDVTVYLDRAAAGCWLVDDAVAA